MTAVAMSLRTYAGFVQYTAADNVFSAAEGLVPGFDQVYQALFCYGWWDNPCNDIDGYWLCKNSWGPGWGITGSVKVAYGSAYIMQPNHTYALQFNKHMEQQATDIRQKLKPALTRDTTKPGCVVYKPLQPQRPVKLADELTILAAAGLPPNSAVKGVDKAVILSDIVTSNLGYIRSLSATGRGPFRVCGQSAALLRAAVCLGSC
uniref:Peptidase C1A papain C-terminal domain-containing protein n=1 Tax=Tetradesmus obliquus TaxID=3088 RepID=A0A383VC45_TETOB|eukprot:jgi/Sobl393_1/3650/SZX62322.1